MSDFPCLEVLIGRDYATATLVEICKIIPINGPGLTGRLVGGDDPVRLPGDDAIIVDLEFDPI